MGTFAKRLGQWAARSLETESGNILSTSRFNKVPDSLSLRLDGTLKEGHDMKVFGLGTVATLASLSTYGKFTAAMHRVYTEMERELDQAAAGEEREENVVGAFWRQHQAILRRAPALAADLEDVKGMGVEVRVDAASQTPGTRRYVEAIRRAGAEDGGAGLLGHLYCRYLADLFGGQMLGTPTQVRNQLRALTNARTRIPSIAPPVIASLLASPSSRPLIMPHSTPSLADLSTLPLFS